MTEREGLMFVMMGIAPEREEEFNAWYDTEHLPERRGCEGFLNARRFEAVQGSPKYLAAYDLASVTVLSSAPYRAFTDEYSPWTKRILSLLDDHARKVYEDRTPDSIRKTFATEEAVGAATGLLAVLADVEAGYESELLAWYGEEHLAERMACPGILRARCFEATDGAPRFLALCDLADLGALETEEYRGYQANRSPRTTEVLSHVRNQRRNVYRRIA